MWLGKDALRRGWRGRVAEVQRLMWLTQLFSHCAGESFADIAAVSHGKKDIWTYRKVKLRSVQQPMKKFHQGTRVSKIFGIVGNSISIYLSVHTNWKIDIKVDFDFDYARCKVLQTVTMNDDTGNHADR